MKTQTLPKVILFSLLLAPCALLHAAPPPELTVLRTQYDKVVAERVTAPFEAALGTLNAKFTAALDKAATEAQRAGNLPAVLAIEEDKKRIAGKLPLPDADDEQTPEPLKKLRAIYREQFKKLEDERAASHSALLPGYTAKLQELEVTLTKASRVDEAKEIMVYRQGLSVGGAPPTAAPAIATSGKADAGKPDEARRNYPKGDDRKAAEWVLRLGGSVKLTVGGKQATVDDAQMLPRGKFELNEVILKFFQGKQPAEPLTDLLPLAGLEKLTAVNTAGLKTLTDDHLAVLSSLPALQMATFNAGSLTDAAFAHLARVPTLIGIYLVDQLNITGTGVAALAKLEKLNHLNLGGCKGLTQEGMAGLAELKQLSVLFLDTTPFSDAHLPLLDGMNKLRDLQVKTTGVTLAGISGRQSLSGLTVLALSVGAGDCVSHAAAVAKNCSSLSNLILAGKPAAPLTAEDIGALRVFSKLRELKLYAPGITDAAPAGISALPDLPKLNFGYVKLTDACLPALASHKGLREIEFGEAQITDEGLMSLASMKGLKKVIVKGCSKLTPDGIAAFKQKRPDVKVE